MVCVSCSDVVDTIISKDHAASIFRAEDGGINEEIIRTKENCKIFS
jgi:hypothetical protein